MTRLFRWHQQRSSASRVIVWTANVHAARTLGANSSVRPFGSDLEDEYGARLASVAFTALAGPTAVAIPPDSARRRGFTRSACDGGGTDPLRYLGRPALAALGAVEAWPLFYGKRKPLDWSLLFDGVVVLREEKPLSMDRPARPRFAPPAQKYVLEKIGRRPHGAVSR
jgi:erythromycin esterase-like protein